MQRYGVFNAEGFPTGFYNDEEHKDNLPEGAVEITEEQLNEFIEFNGYRRWENGQVVVYTPPVVPPVYTIHLEEMWRRMVDEEAEAFDAAIAASPVRLRRMFNLATSITSGTELYGFVEGKLTDLFGEVRSKELLSLEI